MGNAFVTVIATPFKVAAVSCQVTVYTKFLTPSLLVIQHTTLRIKTDDSNRSRWPLHPLWQDLSERVAQMEGLGVLRELDMPALAEERQMRNIISVYGYMKRIAAIQCLQNGLPMMTHNLAQQRLCELLNRIHDPLTWQNDVERRITEMRLGEW